MSQRQQPVPDLQPDAPASPALDATIARIEQGSRDMQQYLDSIEQKIARLEPHIERLSQPSPESPGPAPTQAPDAAEPTVAPTQPVLENAEDLSEPSSSAPRRRRSDRDGFPIPPGDRRRSERLTDSFQPADTLASLHPVWARRLSSPRLWLVAGVSLLLLLLFGWRLSARHADPTAQPGTLDASTGSSAASATPAATSASPAASADATPRNLLPRPSPATPLSPTSSTTPPTSAGVDPTVATATTTRADQPTPDPATPDASPSLTAGNAPASGYTPLHPGQVRVSSGIMAANLIYSRQPEQPGGLAHLFRLSGRVTMQVVVSRTGRVANIRVLSGHHLLRGPAKDAVAVWRYRPFLVNGSPVEVATIVSVDFHR